MRGAVLALTAAMSFGAVSVQLLPIPADPVAAVAAAEVPGDPATPAVATPGTAGPETLDRLVELVLERLNTADAVAAAKWATSVRTGQPPVIDDPVRETEVYDSMAALGADLGLPDSWVRQVFLGQIEANKIVQRGLHGRWRFDSRSVPATPPDLAAVRPVIDRANVGIVRELARGRALLTGPDCTQRLTGTALGVLSSGRVDPLHGAALVRGSAALCSAP
ncbi:chorismate mutase [Nocardia sp. BMG51109]|uniref:chorismate mutase n=1 Tax=Nocardia sp. BMG51109 TaxID=1056816 RepID=UPI000465EB3D|nr:chorismate mutase [Nocardia sp. BMG51109]